MLIRTVDDLGHLVRDARSQTGLTQAELAALVGVSRKWIIDLESGKRAADVSLVLRTLNALGIDLQARAGRGPVAEDDADPDQIIARSQHPRP